MAIQLLKSLVDVDNNTTATTTAANLVMDWGTVTRTEASTSMIQTTKTATGNAVNSMLNVIRATFKQVDKEQVLTPRVAPEMSSPIVVVHTGQNPRSSSASRGRGLNRPHVN